MLEINDVLYCNALQIALHCIALHCKLHCIALHCIALHCIALHCIALHCTALHCIALHFALHCIALHRTDFYPHGLNSTPIIAYIFQHLHVAYPRPLDRSLFAFVSLHCNGDCHIDNFTFEPVVLECCVIPLFGVLRFPESI